MVKVVGLANTLRILSCSNNIFPLVIEICHTSHNKGPSRKFLMNHLHDAHFFEKNISSFKGSLNQTTHIISNHIISYQMNTEYLSNSCRLLGGWLTPDQKKIAPKKKFTKFLPRSEPRHEGDWNVLCLYGRMDRLEVKKRTNMAENLILIASLFGL